MRKIDQIVFVAGIGLIAIGFIIFFENGYPILKEADELGNTLKCEKGLACSSKNVFLPIMKNGQKINELDGSFTFFSEYAFVSMNPINYTVYLKPESEFTGTPYFLIIPSGLNVELVKSVTFDLIRQDFKNNGLIEFQKIEQTGSFYAEGWWKYPTETSVKVLPFIVDSDNQIIFLQESETIFEVETPSAKIKAIDQHRDKIGNKTILALTWIGVAFAPLLLGSDIVVRVLLKEY